MLKKIIPIVLTLCLIFGVSVMAENTNPVNDGAVPEISEQTPQNKEELPQGSGDNMEIPPMGDMQNGGMPPNMQNGGMSREGMNNGQMPGGMGEFPGNMQNFNGQTQEEEPMTFSGFVKTNSTPITSVILLAFAFVFVIFYRRKNY